jgi:transposase
MRQRTFHLEEAAANALNAAYLHCTDANTKTRYQAVRLYGLGYSTSQVQDICGCSRSSLMNWTRAYQERGLTALVDARVGGNRARLSGEQIEAVQNQLHRYTPRQLLGQDTCQGDGQFWSVPDLAALLARDYAVVYQSPTSLRTLLHRCEMSYQRTEKQYKSHNAVKLMDFEEQLEKKSSMWR